MVQQNFSIKINASKEKVWNVLWDDDTYRKWTSVFMPGSHAVSDWEEGSKILFLSADGGGMTSKIVKKIPNKFMSFQHLGMVKDGKEIPATDVVNTWQGMFENYTLDEMEGITHLVVTMDATEEMENYFKDIFPKALAMVKALAENNNV